VVGAPARLTRLAALALRASVPLLFAASAPWTLAAPASYIVNGSCRDGQPHGAYELRMPDGKLRVAGAFNHGKRIGTFLFWSASGARIALLPFDDDAINGTVALWHLAANAKTEPKPKLEAAYANGLLVGGTRSWYPDGRLRAEFRYDQGVLAEARAWNAKGASLSAAESRAMAARDRLADEQFYNTLEAIVRDNPPPCEADGRKP
jgi:hypothetical protein